MFSAVNDFLETNYEIDGFSDYYIDREAIPKEQIEKFKDFVNNRNLYENTYIFPRATEVIKKLNEVYDIYICSACVNRLNVEGCGKIFMDKYNFLIKNFSFLNPEHFIFTNTKNLFKADIQIDDRLSNFDNEIETKILFPSYHNKNISDNELKQNGVIRAGYDWKNGWNEIEKILLKH